VNTPHAALVSQLQATQAGDPWYGSSREAILQGVTANAAAARPIAHGHSIWQIVLHMTSWTREVLRRIKGGVPALPAEGDWPAMGEVSEAAWKRALDDLAAAHAEVVAALGSLTPEQWNAPIGDTREPALGTGVDVTGIVVGLAQHDAYHTGQIAVIKRALTAGPSIIARPAME
jgi:uncharacterized damage-inducible protein DinB